MTDKNVDVIADTLQQKADRASVRAQLQELKEKQRQMEHPPAHKNKYRGDER